MSKTLIVVDNESDHLNDNLADVISFENYLRLYPKKNETKTRIINLCDTGAYLSKGYYCSLLAEARTHMVLPSVKTINELRSLNNDAELMAAYKSTLTDLQLANQPTDYLLYFGQASEPKLQNLGQRLFTQYPAPLIRLKLELAEDKLQLNIECASLSELTAEQRSIFMDRLTGFTQGVWRLGATKKRYRWDMAILINPDEDVPPSNKEAINKFIKAAAKHGIHAEAGTIEQFSNIALYDALFIRETTAIDHYTYRLACKAEDNGLVVIDDPTSILRCCNKVFLHDAFSYQQVPSPQTQVVADASPDTLQRLEQQFSYPFVLKMPESSFSKGVFKVNNRTELETKLKQLFEDSALVLAQEFLYTEFDWRIGVLNGRAIYACRYMMARNHWQIYNHGAKRHTSGGFESLPTFEVPKVVLDAALKAARIIGNGLYGVDIKTLNDKAYVLEVNDNPSIDHKVENAYLGDELYMQIMAEFQRRLEARGR